MIKTMQDAFDALDDLKQVLSMAYSSGYRYGQEAEREACLNCYSPDDTAQDWAEKIKARGQA
jgi:hypothetical protein